MIETVHWKEVVEAVFRRRAIVLLVTVVGISLASLWAWMTPPVYRAFARIQLTAEPALAARGVQPMSERQMEAELAFLKSPALVRRVLQEQADTGSSGGNSEATRAIGLSGLTDFRRSLVSRIRGETPEEQFERRALKAVKRIELSPVGRSNLAEIAYTASVPSVASRFVNDLLKHHVERLAELSSSSQEMSFLEKQLEVLSARWRESREALAAFRSRHGTTIVTGEEEKARNVVTQLESERVAAETKVLELEARSRYLSDEIASYPERIETELVKAESEAVRFLDTRIMELEVQRSEALSRYTPTSTIVRNIDRQIEEAKQLRATKESETLAETTTSRNPAFAALEIDFLDTKAQLTAARARVAALTSQIDDYRQKVRSLEVFMEEYARLQNEVAAAAEAYQSYLREQEDARVATARDQFGIVNIAVIEQAQVPMVPEPSMAKLKVAAGAVLGLLAGAFLAFLRDWLDPAVKSGAQATRLTGVPLLVEIPRR